MSLEPVFACNVQAFNQEQRAQHAALLGQIRLEAEALEELPDGFAFRFKASELWALRLAEFAALERLCCPFLTLEVVFEAADGGLRLRMGGEEGVKAFLVHELGLQTVESNKIKKGD
jgi:hypothetical protein